VGVEGDALGLVEGDTLGLVLGLAVGESDWGQLGSARPAPR